MRDAVHPVVLLHQSVVDIADDLQNLREAHQQDQTGAPCIRLGACYGPHGHHRTCKRHGTKREVLPEGKFVVDVRRQ